MRQYAYFPGCSSSDGGSKAYGKSAIAVAAALNAELKEIEDWNCCGSVPYSSEDELGSLCLSARNLALAEEMALDVVTPCSSCYVNMKRTNATLRDYPNVRAQVSECLAAGNLTYGGGVKVRHLLEIFVNDIGYDAIKTRVKRPLTGLKVGAYYGCQVVRPAPSFDHIETPESLDKLIVSLGAEAVPFPLKTRCCGGSLIISEEALALGLMKKLFDSAAGNGAECLVAVCPLCQLNLDAYQGSVNRKLKTKFEMPVLFFTQLMGLAFGLDEADLDLKTCIVPPAKVLAKAGQGA